jgi:hypothetical protein
MFNRITQSNPLFDQITAAAQEGNNRFDYDGLAFSYNQINVGEMLVFPYLKEKLPTLRAQLEKRGIVHSVDYSLKSVEVDGEVQGVVTRGSDKLTVKVESKPRGPRRKKNAEGSAEAAAATAAATTRRRGTPDA